MRNRIYYLLKPYIPRRARIEMRRAAARRIRHQAAQVWPVLESSAEKPKGWPGWPGGKDFAFVLSHDVEGPRGHDRVRAVAELEMAHGFRSSFNLIPEGDYQPCPKLRQWLVENGFEVGVHDLHHDGRLYDSSDYFHECAGRINRHLKEWGAVGFRSGFMLRNLEWIHALDIAYDASTFDTDPFEPQPDGAETIFPFLVPNPHLAMDSEARTSPLRHPLHTRRGYVELPYTLVQDLNLFVILEEQTIDIWKRKVDWIVSKGGMVHVDTHPDYMTLPGQPKGFDEFDIERYAELLRYVRDNYSSRYWHATPREVAVFTQAHEIRHPSTSLGDATDRRPIQSFNRAPLPAIWIDLDNTPHIPFFEPIIRELEKRGFRVVLSARDAFQVTDMADLKGLRYHRIGRHHGKNPVAKVVGLFHRALQLVPLARRERPIVAVSHGARAQVIASNLLGIPSIVIADYEHAKSPPLMRSTWKMVPEAIPVSDCHHPAERVLQYPGIKEDVYAWTLQPDPSLATALGIKEGDIVTVIRPPATEAHYHNPEAERLFEEVVRICLAKPEVFAVLLPRNKKQREAIESQWPEWFSSRRVVVPEKAVDGLNLLWHSDLVISGGGTMNREAAALGVPVYSIFRGPMGAVDRMLEKEGRLTMVRSVEEVHSKIHLGHRQRGSSAHQQRGPALDRVVEHILEVIRQRQEGA